METHLTHVTHFCDACVNFEPNTTDPHNAPGICERTHGGRPSRMPGDGADCSAFDRITH